MVKGLTGLALRCAAVIAVVGGGEAFAQPLVVGDVELPARMDRVERAMGGVGEVTVARNAALGGDVVGGARVQDAVDGAIARIGGTGSAFVATPHGVGVVAQSERSFAGRSPNPLLARLDERVAVLLAVLESRVELVGALSGLGSEGEAAMRGQWGAVEAWPGAPTAGPAMEDVVAGFLRGAAVYRVEVEDEVVRVAVVSTPAMRGGQWVGGAGEVVFCEALDDGLARVFAEIASGVTPTAGGRVVVSPGEGRVAWVGFGSALMREHRDASVEQRLRSRGVDAARLRAQASLQGLLEGGEVEGSSELDQNLQVAIRGLGELFEAHGFGDGAGVERALETVSRKALAGASGGGLPSGVQIGNYEREGWLYCVAVYVEDVEARGAIGDVVVGGEGLSGAGFEVGEDGMFVLDGEGRLIPKE